MPRSSSRGIVRARTPSAPTSRPSSSGSSRSQGSRRTHEVRRRDRARRGRGSTSCAPSRSCRACSGRPATARPRKKTIVGPAPARWTAARCSRSRTPSRPPTRRSARSSAVRRGAGRLGQGREPRGRRLGVPGLPPRSRVRADGADHARRDDHRRRGEAATAAGRHIVVEGEPDSMGQRPPSRSSARGAAPTRRSWAPATGVSRGAAPGRRPDRRRRRSPPPRGRRSRRRISSASVSTIRAPLAPIGWPSATAPPFTFTIVSSTSSMRPRGSRTAANASLISTSSEVGCDAARLLERLLDRERRAPSAATRTGRPTSRRRRSRASGSSPSSLGASDRSSRRPRRRRRRSATRCPPSRCRPSVNAGRSPARASGVGVRPDALVARRPHGIAACAAGTSTGTTSSANRPASQASAARRCERAAHASCSSRVIAAARALIASVPSPMCRSSKAHQRPSWIIESSIGRVAKPRALAGLRQRRRGRSSSTPSRRRPRSRARRRGSSDRRSRSPTSPTGTPC